MLDEDLATLTFSFAVTERSEAAVRAVEADHESGLIRHSGQLSITKDFKKNKEQLCKDFFKTLKMNLSLEVVVEQYNTLL